MFEELKKIVNIEDPNDPRRLAGARTLWGAQVINVDRSLIELNYGLWGVSPLSAELKKFLFNFVQGRLYLNNVLHRIDNTPPQCTFCKANAVQELEGRGIQPDDAEYDYYLQLQPVETVHHLFWECESVNTVIQKCYRWIRGFDWYRGHEEINKDSFFMGISNNYKNICQTDLIWKHFVKFYIYWCRNCKKKPSFVALKFELEGLFGLKKMAKFRRELMRINLIYDD